MFRNRSANVHQFAMVPNAQIPRSSFLMQHTHKTTFDGGDLVPIYVEEILPGDTFNCNVTIMGRLATPITPIMDNLYLDTFYFYTPYRILWDNWTKFQGERHNPDDSTDFLIPIINSTVGGYAPLSIYDYFGLPTAGQIAPGNQFAHSALPLRAYNRIWYEHFRDQNLQDQPQINVDDGPDTVASYFLRKRGKRHDYFTSCLPQPQKGDPVELSFAGQAPVITGASDITFTGSHNPMRLVNQAGVGLGSIQTLHQTASNILVGGSATGGTPGGVALVPANLYADMASVTAATINDIREAFQIQRMLERDARGGTRQVEQIKARFGVTLPDFRAQRPEYIGGGSTPININPVTQTSATDTESPQGNLAAFGTVVSRNGFTYSATEHGIIIGLASIRADLTYQQGLQRFWSRQTRVDFYEPVFAMLGEQAVLNKEIYCTGITAQDDEVFGYQERWGEYRYHPSMITGLFRSTTPGTLDIWHLAQHFTSLPTLNDTFIQENPPLQRITAVGAEAQGQQIICDMLFSNRAARPMPMYSVPGMIDHF